MLGIGEVFPEVQLDACVSLEKGQEFKTITTQKETKGKWAVYFAWPLDFTFVCPTEIAEFNKAYGQFTDRDAQVSAVTVSMFTTRGELTTRTCAI